ncbi:hypothetical protein DFH11DRAFT_1513950 [Phellopilus nigrolimitatus]|nr:hypothetical protein DFH11DRAFT_1513950 [Phellopilus nigrolimitatus]
MSGSPYNAYGNGHNNGNYAYGSAYANGFGGNYGYGYGGYGYGEDVSVGRGDAFENFERGAEVGGLVYQSPNGNVYPWGERDAVRFRMQTEFGMPSPAGSPPHTGQTLQSPSVYAPNHAQQRVGNVTASPPLSFGGQAHFVPGPVVSTPSPEEGAEEAEFEYFDRAEPEAEVEQNEDVQMEDVREEQGFELRPNDVRHRRSEDEGVRLVVPYSNGGADSVDRRSPPESSAVRERTPSPDFPQKLNPRIASLKGGSSYRSPPLTSQPSLDGTTMVNTSPAPAVAIPTPGISPAHEQDYAQMRSPPESPVLHAGLLSPPDMSPRGRSVCTSPVSGYLTSGSATSATSATSSSGLASDASRSVSESRSDSRGRSRTRNSSLSASDQEPERGRSRSRSTASGANSPLSDSSSPNARGPPMVIGMGAGFGQHSGREVRDGRGVRLYRKTSEDFIGQSDDDSTRGRNRDGRRVSESLSPPLVGSAPVDAASRRSAVSPPNAGTSYRPIPSSGLGYPSYSGNTSGTSSNYYGVSDKHLLLNGVPIVKLPPASAPNVTRKKSLDLSDGASSYSGSSTVSAGGRTLPSCIPEEDEQRSRTETPISSPVSSIPTPQQPELQTKFLPLSPPPELRVPPRAKTGSVSSTKASPAPEANAEKVNGSSSPPPSGTRNKANGASDSDRAAAPFANRAAELVSSARTLLGTIWNGTMA